VSIASVERELGLSEGYLSKIRKSVEPSFLLVALLAIIAETRRPRSRRLDHFATRKACEGSKPPRPLVRWTAGASSRSGRDR
jgi:hypothetical protein